MANHKAQAAKEKGNAAFKSSDYADAVGHYTEAILADRTDPTLPLNRAAAYLKLGKNEDAERDCNAVLKLTPSNVKALFRRGQARLALEKPLEARQDFNDALKLEPSNTSVQVELKNVDQAISAEKSKKSKFESARASFAVSSSPSVPPPKRRRVPIEIFEPGDRRETPKEKMQVVDVKPSGTAPTSGPSSKPVPPTPAPMPTVPATEAKPDVKENTMTPVYTRSLKTPSSTPPGPGPVPSSLPTPQPQPPAAATATATTALPKPSPATFAEAKQARESARQSRVGGGIFRANGRNTIFSHKEPTLTESDVPESQTSRAAQTAEGRGPVVYPVGDAAANRTAVQMSMFNFSKRWEANQSVGERWKLIISTPPASIPSMCKSSLEPALFISIVDVFVEVVKANAGDLATVDIVKAYLMEFEGVPRFSTVLLFLNGKEKARVCELWSLLGVETPSGSCWNSLLT
ncbi:hypothetical protein AX15_003158 [Amanita polypyramis BW_CC]|nr:hypothetical protein AX15_003158 [Amanita polypyramis BW_CC]